ncbi:hypothetical protein [Anatilimnocola floriformis]|uniref:hypothetical protein n=1 Tax=Anatilimnocola floriformis TaxID=2948575 RepID=UPI0020C35618|nr:hypothetical protein [Anatilimnocola floriformis]
MLRQILVGGLLAAAVAVSVRAEDKHEGHKHAAATTSNAQFEKLKKLVGTWVEADKDGKPTDKVVSVMKVTAGGSALQETIFPGEPMEMLSVYTVDGNDLVMTHYCVIGNQPRMKADPKSPADQINFDFAGGGNLDVKKDKHMHGAKLKIVDADHIEIEGNGWEDGAPAKEMCGTMKLVRKK